MLDKLENLEERILSCEKCQDLLSSRLYPMPHFYGKIENITTMIIGINPGPPQSGERERLEQLNYDYRKHYEIGIKSCQLGHFLSRLFEVIKLSWESVFFTNIIKCATPLVRLPSLTEVESCWPFLIEQFELIQPKHLILLSRFTAKNLGIDEPVFTVKKFRDSRVLIIPHPTSIRHSGTEQTVFNFVEEAWKENLL